MENGEMSDETAQDDWPEDQLGPRFGTRPGDWFTDPELQGRDDAWQIRLKRNQQGKLFKSAENVLLILENDKGWRKTLAQNERTLDVTVTDPPFGKGDKRERLIKDADITRGMVWLGNHYDCEPSPKMMADCLYAVAAANSYDRVREYLEGVKWDGTERLTHLLPVYFGSERNAYTEAIGARWMISAVARTFEPGCKSDHVLVIEGEQGVGKSSALAILCGNDDWFGDSIPNIDNKDAQQYLGGTWIVELAEMDAANRAEASTLKSFITSPIDRYRPPYGRFMVNQPRRCVFAGTVNHDTYLKDDTGGRRFWCFAATAINLQGLTEDRDQLWAEAVVRYRRGEAWHLEEPELIELAKREQADRLDHDPWHATVEAWLNRPANRSLAVEGVSSAQVLESALDLEPGRQNQSHMNRVGRVMRSIGWRSERRRLGAVRERRWYDAASQ